MRFLVDECAGPKVAEWLREQGHEVFSVFKEAKGASDDEVLAKAFSESWILVTNDKDFGEMIFRERREHHGVIFLRLNDERSDSKIEILRHLLTRYSEKLADRFVTVTETKVRFAKE